MNDATRDFVATVITHDQTGIDEILGVLGRDQAALAMVAVFTVAVDRRFPDPAEADVPAVVQRLFDTWIRPEALPTAEAEAVIRGGLGEEWMLAGLDAAELLRAQRILSYGLVADLGLEGPARDEFLTEATELAEELIRDHGPR